MSNFVDFFLVSGQNDVKKLVICLIEGFNTSSSLVTPTIGINRLNSENSGFKRFFLFPVVCIFLIIFAYF